ncbi:hypothetical protein UCDDS831_g07227 [Diplodia seriata]|uniref:Uncharacterized protein n=1 Tax=Diplodia seriata TaxID=420778 RepID=A0A0G2GGL9_9PEZI|nr:hypothetical protein UCDDS831_g07227 [Diplodia seriata]
MDSFTPPMGFASEADEQAYAALVEKLNENTDYLPIPGFIFAEPGATTYPAGIFPAMLQLLELAPSVKKFTAAKALVAEAGLARIDRTGSKDKTIHTEDILQALVWIHTGDKILAQPLDSSSSSPSCSTVKSTSTVVKRSTTATIPQRRSASAGADPVKTAADGNESAAAAVITVDMATTPHVTTDTDTYQLTVTVTSSEADADAALSSAITREIGHIRADHYLDKLRACIRERDGAVAAQATMAFLLQNMDRERTALGNLVDDMEEENTALCNRYNDMAEVVADVEKENTALSNRVDDLRNERNEWREAAAEKDDLAERMVREREECWDIADRLQEMVTDRNRQLDAAAGRLGDAEKQRDDWRDIANAVQRQRDDWKDKAGDLKAERDELCARVVARQAERDGWKEYALDVRAQRDCLRGEVERLNAYKDKYSALKKQLSGLVVKDSELETERLRKAVQELHQQGSEHSKEIKDLKALHEECTGLAKEVQALKEERDLDQSPRRKFPKLIDYPR